jgi:microcystin-dependent protein
MACNSYTSGSDAQANLSLGTVSVDPCPSTIQQMAQAIINALTVTLPGNFATFNIGSDTPTPANRDKLWYRVDASCNPLGWYIWTGAAWTRATPLGTPPGLVSHWWSTTLVGLPVNEARAAISFLETGDAYPGGGSTTLHTNPFWLLCDGTTVGGLTTPNLLGRVIVGAGNGSGLTVRAQGDTGGEESHTLSEAELPAHAHAAQNGSASVAVTSAGPFIGYGFNPLPANTSGLTGGGLAHQNMPPYNCVYPVIRTARTI